MKYVVARWRSLMLALSVCIFGSGCTTVSTVKITGGEVRAASADGILVYRGVPFAQPPVGPLRWREPQPVKAWEGVRDAHRFAPACMQTGVSMPGETTPQVSEDCLYLNVWAPARAGKRPLPVLVWIHGGGFANGSASMPLYWGDKLARRGVIVVTVAYRLGPFGFLAHPELTAESPHKSSGNYGLLDQIAALQWVQHNIAAFGGDPKLVTVAGQSAGATSISLLMASPRAKGLFERVIAQSGGAFEPLQLAPRWLLANAERDGSAYAAALGASSLTDLRSLPAADILKAGPGSISHPVVEPYVVPESPYDIFAAGRQNDVPLLVGSNADEARSLADLAAVTASNFQTQLEKAWGKLPPPIVRAYPFSSDEEARKARADLERDLRFGWDVFAWARLQAEHGKSPVYSYHFMQEPPFPAGSIQSGWGASHFAELWYMFDHLEQEAWPWTAGDRRLAAAMAGYWTNFVKSGDPNNPSAPHWPRFEAASQSTLFLKDPILVGGPANTEKLKAFDVLYSQLRNYR